MKSKTILILAATIHQIPFIRRARALGYHVVTCDNRPDNPGHQIAHRSFNVDITDKVGVLKLAREISVDGILAAATDIALPSAANACQHLGLPSPSVNAVSILCDKLNFRALQKRLMLPHPDFFPHLPTEKPGEKPRRWVIKPTRSSGSKGVKVLEDMENVSAAVSDAKHHSTNGGIIVEAYIDGNQGTAEGIIADGRIIDHILTDRIQAKYPDVQTRGHRTPSAKLSSTLKKNLIMQLETIVRELDITGPFDCDFVYSDNSVYILEMAPRAGGNGLSNLVELSTGFDWTGYNIKNVCADVCHENSSWQETVSVGITLVETEKCKTPAYDETGLNEIARMKWVHNISFDVPMGPQINKLHDSQGRVKQIIFHAKNRESLDARADWIEQQILGFSS